LLAGAGAVAGDASSSVDGANADGVGAGDVSVDIVRAGVVIVDTAGAAGTMLLAEAVLRNFSIPGGCGFAGEDDRSAVRGLVLRRERCRLSYYCLLVELLFF